MKVIIKNIAFIYVGIMILSCSESNTPKPNTYAKFLTGETEKIWVISSLSIINRKNPKNIFLYPISYSCEDSTNYSDYDDQYKFYANAERSFEFIKAGSNCVYDERTSFGSTWSIDNATASIAFALPPFAGNQIVTYTIKELNASKMKIQYFDGNYIYQFGFNSISK